MDTKAKISNKTTTEVRATTVDGFKLHTSAGSLHTPELKREFAGLLSSVWTKHSKTHMRLKWRTDRLNKVSLWSFKLHVNTQHSSRTDGVCLSVVCQVTIATASRGHRQVTWVTVRVSSSQDSASEAERDAANTSSAGRATAGGLPNTNSDPCRRDPPTGGKQPPQTRRRGG